MLMSCWTTTLMRPRSIARLTGLIITVGRNMIALCATGPCGNNLVLEYMSNNGSRNGERTAREEENIKKQGGMKGKKQ
jgi:hypothetical protein